MSESKENRPSIWQSIRSMVVEEVPDPVVASVPVTKSGATMRNTPIPTVPVDQALLTPMKAQADQAARQRLEQAISASAPAGYSDVSDTILTLADSIPDESQRYKAALKLAAKHGHSVSDLLGDFDKCIGVLESKGREFQDEIKSQVEKKVGSRQAKVRTIEGLVSQNQSRIGALHKEIEQLTEQLSTENSAISADTARIQDVNDGFTASYDAVLAQLVDQRKKIELYGKVV